MVVRLWPTAIMGQETQLPLPVLLASAWIERIASIDAISPCTGISPLIHVPVSAAASEDPQNDPTLV